MVLEGRTGKGWEWRASAVRRGEGLGSEEMLITLKVVSAVVLK